MTRAQERRVERYLRKVQRELGISEWKIETAAEELDEDGDALAEIIRPAGRRCAWVAFRPDFIYADPEIQRHVVVHELTHVLLNEGEAAVLDGIHELSEVGKSVASLWLTAHEYGVDRVAALLAPTVSLPENLEGKHGRQEGVRSTEGPES